MIPETVKIQGNIVRVRCSGRGYVFVGESYAEIPPQEKRRINNMSYEEHFKPWQREIQKCFEKALRNERQRIKRLK